VTCCEAGDLPIPAVAARAWLLRAGSSASARSCAEVSYLYDTGNRAHSDE
jgi:hypothetical protein